MGDFAMLTRIQRGRGEELRRHLYGIPEDPSPFARRDPGMTHTMRLVVVQTDVPRLLFSSRFDGPERDYLTWFAGLAAAPVVCSFCYEPGPPGAEPLRNYMLDVLDGKAHGRLPDTYP